MRRAPGRTHNDMQEKTPLILDDLKQIIKNGLSSGRILLFRGEEERSFLASFIEGKTPAAPEQVPEGKHGVHALIASCAKCHDVTEKKYGYGTGENGIMVILNAPKMIGAAERKRQKKESVDLMRAMLKAAGIDFERCYITNLIKCESPVMNPSEMFRHCGDILNGEIAAVAPSIVIVMGEIVPLKRIVDANRGISWFSIDHPLTILNNPELKKPAWNTLKLVMSRMKDLGTG